jgi:hypothetical protein
VEPSDGHSVKPSKAKPKVQTFGHELPRPLDLDGHSVKPPKAKPKVQTQRNIPFYSLLKITPPIYQPRSCQWLICLMKRNQRPLNHSLGFHSRPTQTSFKSSSPSSESNHFKLRRLWTLAIVRRVERPNSWFLAIWLVEIDGHVKDIMNTSHMHNHSPPYQPHYSVFLTIPGGCSCSWDGH